MMALITTKISGNTTHLQIPGHRKLISVEIELMQ